MAKTIIISTAAGASTTNGGAYEGSVTWAQCFNTDGSPVSTAASATATDNGSSFVRITKTGAFTNALVDMYVWVDFAATYTDGRYKITARTNDTIDINLAYSADADVTTANVGGAIAEGVAGAGFAVCEALAANGDTVKVHGGPYTTKDATNNTFWYINTSRAVLTVEGVNSSGVCDATFDYATKTWSGTLVELNGTTATVVTGFRVGATAAASTNRHIFRGFDIRNCTGYGIGNPSGGAPRQLEVLHCKIRGNAGAIFFERYCYFQNIEVTAQTAAGLVASGTAKSTIRRAWVHDNTGKGIDCNATNNCEVGESTVTGNTGIGIHLNGGNSVIDCVIGGNGGAQQIRMNYGTYVGNLIYGAAHLSWLDDQIQGTWFIFENNTLVGTGAAGNVGLRLNDVVTPVENLTMRRNIFYGCETGILQDQNFRYQIVDQNCFFDNDTNVSGGNSTTGTNAVTSDPLFVNAGGSDYRIQPGSPCILESAGKVIGAFGVRSHTAEEIAEHLWTTEGRTLT